MAHITYPRVTLGGVTFVFKFSLASAMFVSQRGISEKPPQPGPEGQPPSVFDQMRFMAEQAAVHAHIEDEEGLVHAGWSPERMASAIDVTDMQPIAAAIAEAQGKAMPAAIPPVLPAATA